MSVCQPARTDDDPLSMMMAVSAEEFRYADVSVGSWPWYGGSLTLKTCDGGCLGEFLPEGGSMGSV